MSLLSVVLGESNDWMNKLNLLIVQVGVVCWIVGHRRLIVAVSNVRGCLHRGSCVIIGFWCHSAEQSDKHKEFCVNIVPLLEINRGECGMVGSDYQWGMAMQAASNHHCQCLS